MAVSSNPNVDPNYSNADARDLDAKVLANDSEGTITDPAMLERTRTAAARAESQWLREISNEIYMDESRAKLHNTIRLVSTTENAAPDDEKINTGVESISFNLSPEISESQQVIYAEIGDIRTAGSILIFSGSPSRKWQINAKFLSRTPLEAGNTWKSIQLLRAWTKPDVNYRYGVDAPGIPRVLRLHGYGRTWQGIPVVISSLNVEYPTDIDYIPAAQYLPGNGPNATPEYLEYGTLVPVIQSVSFQLTEARRLDELMNKFNLEEFKTGLLKGW